MEEQIDGKFFNINFNEGIKLDKPSYNSRFGNFLKKGFPVTDSTYYDTPSKDFDIDSGNEKDFNFNINFPIEYDTFSKRDENQNEIKENDSISQQNNLIIKIEKKNIKETTFQETISEIQSKKKNKYLGRKTKRETVSQPESSFHSMYIDDNISVKVQRHFFNFIILFFNSILPHFNYNKRLYKLGQKVKLNIKKKNDKSLNDKTIEYIISKKISEKYKSIDINSNKNICEEIKKNPTLNIILSENYLEFFKKFYYNSDSDVNLRDYYELDKDIKITNLKNFKHFLKKHEKRGNMYIMSIKNVVFTKYLSGSIFKCEFHS